MGDVGAPTITGNEKIDFKQDIGTFASLEEFLNNPNGEIHNSGHSIHHVDQEDINSLVSIPDISTIPEEKRTEEFMAEYDAAVVQSAENMKIFKEKYPEIAKAAEEAAERWGHDDGDSLLRSIVGSRPAAANLTPEVSAVIWSKESLESYANQVTESMDLDINGMDIYGPDIREGTFDQNELAILIKLHELEHATGDQKGSLRHEIISGPLPDDVGKISEYGNSTLGNSQEIDSDIAALSKAEGVVSQETIDWFVASRALPACFAIVNDLLDSDEADPKVEIFNHDTSAFIKEFQDNGSIDYYTTKANLEGFYKTTANECASAGALECNNNHFIPVSVIADVVNKALLKDPCPYSPEEKIIASNFLESVKDFGVKPEPMEELKTKIENDNKIDKAATPPVTVAAADNAASPAAIGMALPPEYADNAPNNAVPPEAAMSVAFNTLKDFLLEAQNNGALDKGWAKIGLNKFSKEAGLLEADKESFMAEALEVLDLDNIDTQADLEGALVNFQKMPAVQNAIESVVFSEDTMTAAFKDLNQFLVEAQNNGALDESLAQIKLAEFSEKAGLSGADKESFMAEALKVLDLDNIDTQADLEGALVNFQKMPAVDNAIGMAHPDQMDPAIGMAHPDQMDPAIGMAHPDQMDPAIGMALPPEYSDNATTSAPPDLSNITNYFEATVVGNKEAGAFTTTAGFNIGGINGGSEPDPANPSLATAAFNPAVDIINNPQDYTVSNSPVVTVGNTLGPQAAEPQQPDTVPNPYAVDPKASFGIT